MGITLMPYIKNQTILTGIKDTMNRDDQLHRSQAGSQMTAGMRNDIQNTGPQQTAQGNSFAVGQAAEVVAALLQTKNGNTSR